MPTPMPTPNPTPMPTPMPTPNPTPMPTDAQPATGECQGRGEEIDRNPSGQIIVCKDRSQSTCENDFETLCPPTYDLCSVERYNELNNDWNAQSIEPYLGKAYCRSGNASAGHVGFWGQQSLSTDLSHSYTFGASLPACPHSWWGCNEQQYSALCCNNSDTPPVQTPAPTPMPTDAQPATGEC